MSTATSQSLSKAVNHFDENVVTDLNAWIVVTTQCRLIMPSASSDDLDYAEISEERPTKRRRTIKVEEKEAEINFVVRLPPRTRSSVLQLEAGNEDETFEESIETEGQIAPAEPSRDEIELDDYGNFTRPSTAAENSSFVQTLSNKQKLSQRESLLLRKLELAEQRKAAHITEPRIVASETSLTPLTLEETPQTNPEVLDALYNIATTPFVSSFLSRLHGTRSNFPPGLIAVDWESRTSWMNLMADIREHYTLAHPERESPIEDTAPITYSTLHEYQLPQIHDLLERSFWTGIDVSDSLDYMPERTTVVAMYKKVVIGIAIIMSPIQTYITYLAVKAGWDKAQIARTMLFHLISMHPDKDFTLHVSTNSSAMLLYNQFGFKAEEFVIDFYSNYLDPSSRASKNAFKLRLRHLG